MKIIISFMFFLIMNSMYTVDLSTLIPMVKQHDNVNNVIIVLRDETVYSLPRNMLRQSNLIKRQLNDTHVLGINIDKRNFELIRDQLIAPHQKPEQRYDLKNIMTFIEYLQTLEMCLFFETPSIQEKLINYLTTFINNNHSIIKKPEFEERLQTLDARLLKILPHAMLK